MAPEDRIKQLEAVVADAIDYVIGCIGSSYCETSEDDWKTLHEWEDALGVERTKKSAFY